MQWAGSQSINTNWNPTVTETWRGKWKRKIKKLKKISNLFLSCEQRKNCLNKAESLQIDHYIFFLTCPDGTCIAPFCILIIQDGAFSPWSNFKFQFGHLWSTYSRVKTTNTWVCFLIALRLSTLSIYHAKIHTQYWDQHFWLCKNIYNIFKNLQVQW